MDSPNLCPSSLLLDAFFLNEDFSKPSGDAIFRGRMYNTTIPFNRLRLNHYVRLHQTRVVVEELSLTLADS